MESVSYPKKIDQCDIEAFFFFGARRGQFISTASGALVVGGVRDIYIYVVSIPGDSFECSME